MSVKNGTLILLSVGSSKVDALTQNDMSFTTSMLDITTKDSGLDAEYVPDQRSGTFSAQGLWDETSDNGFSVLFAAQKAGTLLTVKWGATVPGSKYYSASAYISSLSATAPKNAIASWSGEFQITGAVTEGTVA